MLLHRDIALGDLSGAYVQAVRPTALSTFYRTSTADMGTYR